MENEWKAELAILVECLNTHQSVPAYQTLPATHPNQFLKQKLYPATLGKFFLAYRHSMVPVILCIREENVQLQKHEQQLQLGPIRPIKELISSYELKMYPSVAN